nr:septum formation initiator family protein [Facklamia miroungae]
MNEKNNQQPNRKILPFDQTNRPLKASKKSRQGRFSKHMIPIVGVFLTCLSIFSLFQSFQKHKEVTNQLVQAEVSLKDSIEKNKQAKAEYELSKDKEYIAKIARKDYFFSKDNEIIFDIEEESSEQ